ncbi:hypothetical protein [Pseudomonas sp. PGPR81]|uniref:hypothetical protein n=1 Tax=Pseudomonas sp. PGPR81 TaxID=2913477 RepID=UPI001EDB55D6|nr:hypothetical protein [Pseudomonas sp. PGPR81]
MKRTPQSIERALNEEILRVERERSHEKPNEQALETVEPPAVKQAIRDILSLEPGEPIPATDHEIELFSKIYCLMSTRNRKWLSESHIAFPFAQISASSIPREAALKSRLRGDTISTAAAQTITGIALRNDFLKLLVMCLPQLELDTYPHLLSLFDNGFMGTVPVHEVGAWYVLTYFQQNTFHAERTVRPIPTRGTTLADLVKPAYILSVHERIFSQLPEAIASARWRSTIDHTPASSDSLFSRLLMSVALNRLMLEQWAYVRRVEAAAPLQLGLLAEFEKSAPNGFGQILADYQKDGVIDFCGLTKVLLADALAKRKDIFTPNIVSRIDQQANAIIESSSLEEFSGDMEVNRAFMRFPEHAKALAWLALTWSYLKNGAFPEDEPTTHAPTTRLISRRSEIVSNGQHMVSLRRLVSTLVMNQSWALPSTERTRLHIQYVGDVRALLLSSLQEAFKRASLAQWNSVLYAENSVPDVAQAFQQIGLPPPPDASQTDPS